jgi:hypothetical protein
LSSGKYLGDAQAGNGHQSLVFDVQLNRGRLIS